MHWQKESDSVEILVNILRNGLDLRVEIILNIEHVILVVLADEVDRKTEMAEPTRTTDPVEVSVGLTREIEVDYDVYGDDIDTTGEIFSLTNNGLPILSARLF